MDQFLSMAEARELLGVSKPTMWRMVRDGRLTAYGTPADRRRRFVRRADVEALKTLRPIEPEAQTEKATA